LRKEARKGNNIKNVGRRKSFLNFLEYTNKPDDFEIFLEKENKKIIKRESKLKRKESRKKHKTKKYQKIVNKVIVKVMVIVIIVSVQKKKVLIQMYIII